MLTCPGRRFRLRLKTTVTAVLLISVFISSSFLVNSVHAQTTPPATGTVTLIPNVGSCNPFANTLPNSERFLTASGYDDLSANAANPPILASDYEISGGSVLGSGQLVREAAVYANGSEPMAIAIAYASVTAASASYYDEGVVWYTGGAGGWASAVLENWPYLIFNKTTGMPLTNYHHQSISVDLNYSDSMTVQGGMH